MTSATQRTAPPRPETAEVPPSPAGPQPTYLDAADEILARITDGLCTPGTRLTLTYLTRCTDYAATDLRLAMEHLAGTDAVEAVKERWYVPDDRPDGYTARRAAQLLGAVIGQGAYPPDTRVPVREELARILLATPADVNQALDLLAGRGVLRFSSRARPRVERLPGGLPAEQWPQRLLAIAREDPTRQRLSAPFSRPDIQATRDAALQRWRYGTCLPARDMTWQETLQHDVLARVARKAYDRADQQFPQQDPRLREAAARAMACRDLPTVGVPLHERLYRFAVLATALADLANALATPARYGSAPRR
ncbi:hypothetical protein PUR49_08230 [Streptomyces sp. BE147]|uniref:hypothetical protein n=1 Tax=Streptomyces sp. BE147 TaxID=3002524 RepID=UPI002E77FDAF|nr:hypothetical protein [Streptomyces sp. BE147]MEE1736486.1 hypothetical protein [Streptomyces sp. BE147]